MLETVAEYLECTIDISYPITEGWGEYDSTAHTIRLHPELAGVKRTAVLAHELGHAAHQHSESTHATEWEADRFAHWLLVPLCDYLRATRLHPTVQAVAHELEILPSMAAQYAHRLRWCDHERPGTRNAGRPPPRQAST